MAEEEYLNSRGKGGMVYLEQETDSQSRKILLGEPPKIPQPSTLADKNISMSQGPEKTLQDEPAQQNRNTIEAATSMLQQHHDTSQERLIRTRLIRSST